MRGLLRRSRAPQVPSAAALLDDVALPVRRWPERRAVVLGVALALFAGLLAVRLSTSDVNAGIGLLFVVPTAMVALELGLVAGLCAAVLATALIATWSLARDVDLGALGLITRAVVFLSVGALSGRFSDRMRESAARQRRLLESGLSLAHLGDAGQLPALVAAFARRAVDADGARATLDDRGTATDGTVGPSPVRVPVEARGERIGLLEIEPARPLAPEDEAMVAALALQVAVATENQRLLAAERERAELGAQLVDARRRLTERGDQLREILVDQEHERGDVARRLHEESAQAMAAILLGLGAVERTLDSDDDARPQLDALREHAEATLVGLRGLALGLRPPVLDLGLAVALERLGERRRPDGLEELAVALNGVSAELTRDDETAIYRIVEEALDAYDRPRRAEVQGRDGGLAVIVTGRDGQSPRPERLATIGARVDVLGGRLARGDDELRISIPLHGRRVPPS